MTENDAEGGRLPQEPDDLEKLTARLEPPEFKEAQSAFSKAMAKYEEPYLALQQRMKSLTDIAGEGSALGGVAKQIADQQRSIEALGIADMASDLLKRPAEDILSRPSSPRIDMLQIPPNPILETNKRLQRIEDRFEQMQSIAADSAKIATGLQAAAAEFLQKFEAAAADNDRTVKTGIRISLAALFFAVIVPLAQTLYSEFTAGPDNSLALQAAVDEMQAELAALREAQTTATDRLTDALVAADQDATTILRDIRSLLSAPPAAEPEKP